MQRIRIGFPAIRTKEGLSMKKAFGILAAGVFAACGSSSSNNGQTPPTPTSYSYGTGTPVSTGSQQQSAATDANTTTQGIVTATQSGTVQDNASTLSNAPELPNTIIAQLGAAQMANKNPAYDVVGNLSKATKSGALDTGCYTVSGNTITYNNCNIGDSTFTYSISGSLTATATSITWNIKADYAFNSSGESETVDGTWTGDLTFTVTTTDTIVNGTATAEYSGNFTSSSENVSFAYTAQVVFKSLDANANCDGGGGVIGGKLDVSVTAVASNGSAAQVGFENFGYEFTWTGCDTILVATGTAN
jgi:hypothetical protein